MVEGEEEKRDRKEGRRWRWRVEREKEGRKDLSPFSRAHACTRRGGSKTERKWKRKIRE